MTSRRERVSSHGILRGGGLAATCTVHATKVSPQGEPSIFGFVNYTIENVSAVLPDGRYELTAYGTTTSLRKESGHWHPTED
jgi:hypothetical protein